MKYRVLVIGYAVAVLLILAALSFAAYVHLGMPGLEWSAGILAVCFGLSVVNLFLK